MRDLVHDLPRFAGAIVSWLGLLLSPVLFLIYGQRTRSALARRRGWLGLVTVPALLVELLLVVCGGGFANVHFDAYGAQDAPAEVASAICWALRELAVILLARGVDRVRIADGRAALAMWAVAFDLVVWLVSIAASGSLVFVLRGGADLVAGMMILFAASSTAPAFDVFVPRRRSC